MPEETERPEIKLKPATNAKKTLHDPDGIGLTTRELKLLAKYPEVLAGDKTLAQITIESGLARDVKNAGSVGERKLHDIKKKCSQNDMLLEALRLNGATLEDAAATMGDMLRANKLVRVQAHAGNIEGVRETPDNSARQKAAEFIIEAHGAMPEKKVISETRTYEEKITIVGQIKKNPELAMQIARRLTGKTEETNG